MLPLFEQERLEKEKKLSKDLGQAATKLQQLLKATQEQLTKERETVRTLQEHLEGKVTQLIRLTSKTNASVSTLIFFVLTLVLKGEYVELKEGTSV